MSDAAARLLQKDQAEAQQQQIQQKMQDPVVQAQMQDLQIKQQEVQRKTIKDQEELRLKEQQQEIERKRIESQERIAGVNAGIKAASQKQTNDQRGDYDAAKIKLDAFKAGVDLMRNR